MIAYFAVPGLILFFFLLAWRYPPLWLLDLMAFAPPVAGAIVFAIRRMTGRPLRAAGWILGSAWAIGAAYVVMHLGEVPLLDWVILLLVASGSGVVTAWLAARHLASRPMEPGRKTVAMFGFAGFATAYVYGTAALVNVQVDLAPPQYFTARVVEKSADRGRHPNWYVTLGPWGAERNAVRHGVWPEVYDTLDTGDIACVDLHRGLLGLRWIDIAPCAPFERALMKP